MKNLVRLVVLSLAGLFSISAFAVTAQSGVYVGANGGWASPSSKPSLAGYTTKNRNYTFGGSLGYNYALSNSVTAGVEANYSDFGKTNYSSSTGNGSFQNSALQLLLTGTYLMDNGFNTFVKLGAAHEQSTLTINGDSAGTHSWLPAAAAGLGYKILHNLSVYGQYERTFGKNWENATTTSTPSRSNALNVFSVGVDYTFPM